jgi:hypothetical protein
VGRKYLFKVEAVEIYSSGGKNSTTVAF